MEVRRSNDRLISTMGFPIPVRLHLYIESGPWFWDRYLCSIIRFCSVGIHCMVISCAVWCLHHFLAEIPQAYRNSNIQCRQWRWSWPHGNYRDSMNTWTCRSSCWLGPAGWSMWHPSKPPGEIRRCAGTLVTKCWQAFSLHFVTNSVITDAVLFVIQIPRYQYFEDRHNTFMNVEMFSSGECNSGTSSGTKMKYIVFQFSVTSIKITGCGSQNTKF